MRSAEDILKICSEEYANGKVEYNLTHPGIIKAMKEYAKEAIEEQLNIIEYQSNYMSIKECNRVELK